MFGRHLTNVLTVWGMFWLTSLLGWGPVTLGYLSRMAMVWCVLWFVLQCLFSQIPCTSSMLITHFKIASRPQLRV